MAVGVCIIMYRLAKTHCKNEESYSLNKNVCLLKRDCREAAGGCWLLAVGGWRLAVGGGTVAVVVILIILVVAGILLYVFRDRCHLAEKW